MPHHPYNVNDALSVWRPREKPKREVAENFDHYHDEKGRFTTKDGAATPRGADGPHPKDSRGKNKSVFIAQTQSDSVLPSSEPGLTEIEPGPLTFTKLLRHYPSLDDYPTVPTPGKTTVFRFIGNKVAENEKTFGNACTIRLSFALNRAGLLITKAGLPILFEKRLVSSGADKMWYIYTVAALDAYLRKNLNTKRRVLPPKRGWQKELQGQFGIIEFEARPGEMGNATGHFTLYDGITNVDGIHHDYWAQSKHIYFWSLPYE
jgi:hypothetical protein